MIDAVALFAKITNGVSIELALLLFSLIFTRWLAISILLPFLGAQLLPSTVRIGLALTLSFITVIPLLSHPLTPPPNLVYTVFLFFKEALIGFSIGLLSSLIFFTYELMGELMDFARGSSMSKMLVPEVKHQSSSLGVLLFQLSLVIFIGIGLHREILRAIYQSFTSYPPLSLEFHPFHENALGLFLPVLASLFELAVMLALPVIFIGFLTDLGFGLVNRVAPQINAYFLSLPAKTVSGLMIFAFALPFIFDDFFGHHQRFFVLLVRFISG